MTTFSIAIFRSCATLGGHGNTAFVCPVPPSLPPPSGRLTWPRPPQHASHLADGVLPAAGAGLHVRLQLVQPLAQVLVALVAQLRRLPGHHQLLQVVLQDDHPAGGRRRVTGAGSVLTCRGHQPTFVNPRAASWLPSHMRGGNQAAPLFSNNTFPQLPLVLLLIMIFMNVKTRSSRNNYQQ